MTANMTGHSAARVSSEKSSSHTVTAPRSSAPHRFRPEHIDSAVSSRSDGTNHSPEMNSEVCFRILLIIAELPSIRHVSRKIIH